MIAQPSDTCSPAPAASPPSRFVRDRARLGRAARGDRHAALHGARALPEGPGRARSRQVAKIGYREVEYGGGGYDAHGPRDAAQDDGPARPDARRRCISATTRCCGKFDQSVTMAKTLGADTVVLPYMTDEHRTEAGWNAALPNFNRFAADLKKAGLGFAYHNHDFEFTTKPGGVSLYDRLAEGDRPGAREARARPLLGGACRRGPDGADRAARRRGSTPITSRTCAPTAA